LYGVLKLHILENMFILKTMERLFCRMIHWLHNLHVIHLLAITLLKNYHLHFGKLCKEHKCMV